MLEAGDALIPTVVVRTGCASSPSLIVVPEEGFEPTRPCGPRSLSPLRLAGQPLRRARKRNALQGPRERQFGGLDKTVTDGRSLRRMAGKVEATGGIEPPNRGFADLPLN